MLAVGSRFGPYEVLGLLGAGGMGRVYRAMDTRLDRVVALKIPGEQYSERFLREARAIAALSHPNICALYDVGPGYLVMEYLEGQPLRGPLAWRNAVAVASQILDALDAAHRRGITHRDLKPSNLLFTSSGVKLLDFGLAKVTIGKNAAVDATQTQSLTAEKTIIGTPGYMSPEQVEGRAVDARTDVFAFGCVLYELLVGKPAFEGETAQRTMAAVLSSTPRSVAELNPEIPGPLVRIVEMCLQKDPDLRWQNVRDIKAALSLVEAPERSHHHTLRWKIAGMVTLAAVLAGVIFISRRTERVQPNPRVFSVAPPAGTASIQDISISPDGSALAMAAGGQAWIRPITSQRFVSITGSQGVRTLFWSPDSRFLGFCAEGNIKRVPATGGDPQTIAPAADCWGAAWRDGEIVFSPGTGTGLWRISASGGRPEQVSAPGTGETDHVHPAFLPDGKLLYTVNGASGGVTLASYTGSRITGPKLLVAHASKAAYVPLPRSTHGVLTWQRETLMAQEFDYRLGRLLGEARPIGVGIAPNPDLLHVAGDSTAVFHSTGLTTRTAVLFDSTGNKLKGLTTPRVLLNLRFAPNSLRVAWTERGPDGGLDVYVHEIDRAVTTRLTSHPAADGVPVWSPAGDQIAFASWREGTSDIYVIPGNGSGTERPLLRSKQVKYPTDWSRDGSLLLFEQASSESGWDLWVLPLDHPEQTPFAWLASAANERDGRFSPDGRWVAYASNETGSSEVYLQSFPAGRGKWRVSTQGGAKPVWNRQGTKLYYLDRSGAVIVVPISSGTEIKAGKPERLFDAGADSTSQAHSFDADARDRFVTISTIGVQPPPTVVLNWRPELP
jgi:serine/threonine protein kinase